jgi:hypothetical protein
MRFLLHTDPESDSAAEEDGEEEQVARGVRGHQTSRIGK